MARRPFSTGESLHFSPASRQHTNRSWCNPCSRNPCQTPLTPSTPSSPPPPPPATRSSAVSCRSRCRCCWRVVVLLARARWRGEEEGEAVRESVRMRGEGDTRELATGLATARVTRLGRRRASAVLHRAQRRFLCPPLPSTLLPAFLPRKSLRPRLLQPHEQQHRSDARSDARPLRHSTARPPDAGSSPSTTQTHPPWPPRIALPSLLNNSPHSFD